MRDELLNETPFRKLDHDRETVVRWIADYDDRRPHSAIDYAAPAASAVQIALAGDPLREMERLRSPPVAIPAQSRQTNRQAAVVREQSGGVTADPSVAGGPMRGAKRPKTK